MNSSIFSPAFLTEVQTSIIAAVNDYLQQQIKSSPPPEIIDQDELSKRLGICKHTIIAWSKKGKIPCIRIGASVRYNWPAVVDFLEKKTGK